MIKVNSVEQEFIAGETLTELLVRLGFDPAKTVVELNREVVKRATYNDVKVPEGASLEVLNFVGGG
ncbi:MAG: sulfur carrier protein ThiS [Lactobacillales bacterium]|jgi:thiamine biosynthesis protein ThiS|nr:sulfur carrier protein ThiS [Lactobacillales bacterium]